jgi:hypothetical protein
MNVLKNIYILRSSFHLFLGQLFHNSSTLVFIKKYLKKVGFECKVTKINLKDFGV